MYKAAVASGLKWLLDILFEVFTAKKSERTLSSLRDEIKIYKEMMSLLEEDGVDRVLFFILHNGGHRINPLKSKFVTFIEEAKSDKDAAYVDKYQKKLVDIVYMQKLIKAVFSSDNTMKFKVSDLSNGLIKDTYQAHGLKESIITYIAFNKDHIWFLSVNSDSSLNEHDESLKTKIRNAKNSIANILENYYKLEGR